MLRSFVVVAVREQIVKQDRLAAFRFHFECVAGVRVEPPRKGSLATFHVVVQIKENGGKSARLSVYQSGHGKVVVRSLWLWMERGGHAEQESQRTEKKKTFNLINNFEQFVRILIARRKEK